MEPQVQPGDLVKWEWRLQADSWEATQFLGIILDKSDVSNGTVLRVLDNTGQVTTVRTDVQGMEVISATR